MKKLSVIVAIVLALSSLLSVSIADTMTDARKEILNNAISLMEQYPNPSHEIYDYVVSLILFAHGTSMVSLYSNSWMYNEDMHKMMVDSNDMIFNTTIDIYTKAHENNSYEWGILYQTTKALVNY